MLADFIPTAEEEAARRVSPVAIAIATIAPPADPFRHARLQFQRSILTNSLLERALACGADLPSYEKIMREFIWTLRSDSR